MSKKITAARRNAFLAHLANSGNITLSAERAKVSRSWVRLQRSQDRAFDEACREAIAVALERLRQAPDQVRGDGKADLPANWLRHEGQELVVGGTRGRRTQIRRARLRQWSPTAEDRFLAVLSATCNVRAACRDAGLAISSAYAHRARWPGFAKRWDQAVEIGMIELESRLHENIAHFFDPELREPAAPMQDICVMDAIRMLRMYDRRGRRDEG